MKVLEQLAEIQKEVSATTNEIIKTKKRYRDEQHVTNEARLKAASANAKRVSQLFVRTVSFSLKNLCKSL